MHDQVGGEFAYDVMQHMSTFGRIAQCGSISEYNAVRDSKPMGMCCLLLLFLILKGELDF